jgi:hypothetical protein
MFPIHMETSVGDAPISTRENQSCRRWWYEMQRTVPIEISNSKCVCPSETHPSSAAIVSPLSPWFLSDANNEPELQSGDSHIPLDFPAVELRAPKFFFLQEQLEGA